jgi:glycosyltransferase involved in cell wall biosynthesis
MVVEMADQRKDVIFAPVMPVFSVVIICKNESDVIGRTLQSLQGLTDDIVVFDSGSTDGTIEKVQQFPVKLFRGEWEGFGVTKKKATRFAAYDWILALDADESIDDELKKSLTALPLGDERKVYAIRRKNFLGHHHLKYGEWGKDKQNRLFNRRQVNWDEATVHEKLDLPPGIIIEKVTGHILHSTMKDNKEYAEKMVKYAMLNAEKYRQLGKRSSWLKIRIAPAFSFFKNYIVKLGFLDGHAGYICAKMTAWYTFLKYARLKELTESPVVGESVSPKDIS